MFLLFCFSLVCVCAVTFFCCFFFFSSFPHPFIYLLIIQQKKYEKLVCQFLYTKWWRDGRATIACGLMILLLLIFWCVCVCVTLLDGTRAVVADNCAFRQRLFFFLFFFL
uniref:Uncharacterized protein n=1 Tax=Trypanosoma vivax (strain Y486) TaxID=1055687 RepID=G0U5N9_TRYVY|nr:hypothetical protein, unlikely [Trypanosoma vivax Y486]